MEVKVEESLSSTTTMNGLDGNQTSSSAAAAAGKNGKKKAKRKNKSKNTTENQEQQQQVCNLQQEQGTTEMAGRKQNGVERAAEVLVDELSRKVEESLQLHDSGLTNGTLSGSEIAPSVKAEPAPAGTGGGGKKRHRNKQKSKGQQANSAAAPESSGSGHAVEVIQQKQPQTSDNSKNDDPQATTTSTATTELPAGSEAKVEPAPEPEEPPKPQIVYQVYESELQMPSIMSLIQKDLSEPYSIYTYRYFIHNWPRLCFLALHDQRCVGAIVCKLDIHRQNIRRGYIAMLAVDKDYRKLKIGTTLVQKAIQAMLEDHADEVVLETEITNRPALRLYENLGFVRDKRLFHYYLNGVDALRLKLWFR